METENNLPAAATGQSPCNEKDDGLWDVFPDGKITSHKSYETFVGHDDEQLTERIRLLLKEHYSSRPGIEVFASKNIANKNRTLIQVRSIKRYATGFRFLSDEEVLRHNEQQQRDRDTASAALRQEGAMAERERCAMIASNCTCQDASGRGECGCSRIEAKIRSGDE